MYCPNCAAQLTGTDDLACWNCEATFTHPDGWKPTEKPDGEFRPFAKTRQKEAPAEVVPPKEPSSLGVKILKACVAIPLFVVGGACVLLLPVTGGFTALPALLFLGIGIGVVVSSNTSAKIMSIGIGGVMLFLVFLVLKVISAAAFSR